jgi:hypothetical protein
MERTLIFHPPTRGADAAFTKRLDEIALLRSRE